MAPTIRTIAKYTSHQDYSVDFFGEVLNVTVTRTPSIIRQWIRDVVFRHRCSRSCHPLVVGVGVQWTPSWHFVPPSYDRPADTLQLCVGQRCIIIQLSYCKRVPDAFRSFLTNPDTTFVGVRNSQDAKKLERTRHQLEIGQLLDGRKYVVDSQGMSVRGCSLEDIVKRCMGLRGVRLDREISKSDWSVEYLSHDQLLQASVDAFVCFDLGVGARLWEVRRNVSKE